MDPLRSLIVEDEAASRETLRNYLGRYCPEVEVVAEADSVQSGLEAIRRHKPELVFLDVEMPYGNAFDLLEQAGEIDFDTIFVTAFSHYAMKALNFSAAYYLLKPVDIDELVAAVKKVIDQRHERDRGLQTRILVENLRTVAQQDQKVVLPVLDGFEVVRVGDIIRCQANGNFTDFFLKGGGKKMICRALKHYEEALSGLGFLRVHKSHLVNLEFVRSYKKGKGGFLTLEEDHVVEVSPNKKQELLDRF